MPFTNKLIFLLLVGAVLTTCADASLNSKNVSPSPIPTESPTPIETPVVQPSSAQNESRELLAYKTEVFAGTGIEGHRDGTLLEAQFSLVANSCSDPKTEEIYLLDLNRIRKITSQKKVITVAGSGTSGYKDGSAEQALFSYPKDCVVDSSGNVLIADIGNRRIRKLSPNGLVTTLAGDGQIASKDGYLQSSSFSILENINIFKDQLIVSDDFYLRKITEDGVFKLNDKQASANQYGGPTGHKLPIDLIVGPIENVSFGGGLLLTNFNDNLLVIADINLGLLFTLNDKNEVNHLIPSDSDDPNDYILDSGFFVGRFYDIATYEHQLIITSLQSFRLLDLNFPKPKVSEAVLVNEKNEPQYQQIRAITILPKKHEMYYFNYDKKRIEKIFLNQPQKIKLPL